jgi:hypothetical protein
MMTAAAPYSNEPVGILRWIFLKDAKALTCEIRMNGRASHDVCVLPHWNIADTTVERYGRAAEALRRHAEIASQLRDAGWMLVRPQSSDRPPLTPMQAA